MEVIKASGSSGDGGKRGAVCSLLWLTGESCHGPYEIFLSRA